MSDDSDSKPYLYSSLEVQDGGGACSSMAQLHRMAGFTEGPELGLPSEGSDSSSQDPPVSPHSDRKMAHSLHEEDVEMKSSSGSSGSGTESHGNESHGNESHGNESHGNESTGSSNGHSKDSALLESSGSNKRSVREGALKNFRSCQPTQACQLIRRVNGSSKSSLNLCY